MTNEEFVISVARNQVDGDRQKKAIQKLAENFDYGDNPSEKDEPLVVIMTIRGVASVAGTKNGPVKVVFIDLDSQDAVAEMEFQRVREGEVIL